MVPLLSLGIERGTGKRLFFPSRVAAGMVVDLKVGSQQGASYGETFRAGVDPLLLVRSFVRLGLFGAWCLSVAGRESARRWEVGGALPTPDSLAVLPVSELSDESV